MSDERRPFPSLTALVLLAAGLYAFYRVHEALTPFVLAAAFAYILGPVVGYFEAKGFKRIAVIVGGYLLALALGFAVYLGLKAIALEEIRQLSADMPVYMHKLRTLAPVAEAEAARRLPIPPAAATKAIESLTTTGMDAVQSIPSQVLIILPLLLHGILVPFIGFFFLKDAAEGMEQMIQTTPSRYVEQAIHLIGEIDHSLGGYVRGLVITATAIGVVSFVGLVIMGVDNALAIAALSGLCSVVPYMGAVMGILVGGAMAWYQFGTFWAFGKVALFFIGLRVADEILLQPVISKQTVHLHPMVNLLVLVLGGEMFGFMGLVFAVPAACIAKALIKVAWSWYATESGLEAPIGAACESVPYT